MGGLKHKAGSVGATGDPEPAGRPGCCGALQHQIQGFEENLNLQGEDTAAPSPALGEKKEEAPQALTQVSACSSYVFLFPGHPITFLLPTCLLESGKAAGMAHSTSKVWPFMVSCLPIGTEPSA